MSGYLASSLRKDCHTETILLHLALWSEAILEVNVAKCSGCRAFTSKTGDHTGIVISLHFVLPSETENGGFTI